MSETNELEALARRAVACQAWRWMLGVRYWFSAAPDDCYRVVTTAQGQSLAIRVGLDPIPDLSDAATLGCLLALVREASGDPLAHTYPLAAGGWACWFGCVDRSGATEAEAMIAVLETIAEHAALVAALEAAPEVKP